MIGPAMGWNSAKKMLLNGPSSPHPSYLDSLLLLLLLVGLVVLVLGLWLAWLVILKEGMMEAAEAVAVKAERNVKSDKQPYSKGNRFDSEE